MWLPWTLVSRDIQDKSFLSTWITAVSSWVAILSSPVRVMTSPPLGPVPMGGQSLSGGEEQLGHPEVRGI